MAKKRDSRQAGRSQHAATPSATDVPEAQGASGKARALLGRAAVGLSWPDSENPAIGQFLVGEGWISSKSRMPEIGLPCHERGGETQLVRVAKAALRFPSGHDGCSVPQSSSPVAPVCVQRLVAMPFLNAP